jgi:beta-phosphoglucomutase-like phosphatase (HAD superfamily)
MVGGCSPAELELVIFDCDGVLVDSEPISNRVLNSMLAELGLSFSLEEVYERFMGRSMQHCLQVIEQLRGIPPPPGFAADYHQRTAAAFAEQLTAVAGIRTALDALTIPCCVASSGDHAKMRTTLRLVGLLPRFEGRLFSVTEVALASPRPTYSCMPRGAAVLAVKPAWSSKIHRPA